jgi:hypothetical protein
MAPRDIFIDGLGNFSLQNGVVRIELATLESLPLEGATPNMVIHDRLALSIDTFLRIHASMGKVITDLEAKGVIKKNPA